MKKIILTAAIATVFAANVSAADAPKELNLGILGGQNATQQIGDNQCVKAFFDKELNVDTKLRNSSDYSGVIQGLLGGKVDMVLSMSPSSYASVYINDPKAVDVVGIVVDDADKSRGYHSVVVVKADSPYKTLADLKGKSFGMADPDSTSGFLIPNQSFKKDFGGSVDDKYNGHFSSVTFSGGHEQDVLGVLNGQFDGAVTWASMIGDYNTGYTSGAFTRMIRAGQPDLMKKIRIIWQSPLIPNGPILVSNKLPADFKAKLITAIKKLDKEQHSCFVKAVGGAQHIGPATVADYQAIIDMKRELTKAR
ncbi:phosphonate ABC transporter substrate-binding protein [bacteria symbiont BFo1 of Frankliniella occidentalis]|jgi:phosphonate transport system substrate-binding protein|uniref:Phosphonate ABC transporter substrate-binding protein n=1 Tax=Erwinia aphidicola TaxID=68334 RepID=A0ABU8DI70_ERWAP|nr:MULTISPECIES: phosphonate ABC transporter substrate-binding protein [Erwinia]KYP84336.1 phosphonate ABC transporter substrate-binding protein [bacteria symbiont BFo1 of Frankliniella occidentalis]PIJ54179.1 phosphonate ABC transporter substrate-binding protein [Erwinia sp. OLMDLW33]KYP91075.1 phosphonate ABC transporter substrate-binding protein [bacteria symbiont BFo1 of Frankliniella occidentalis]MBD1374304.1 phosphonate ABC transporter substrate-binding protein [Erwinia aphidicola]MCP223